MGQVGRLATLQSELEEIWGSQDRLFDGFSAADWNRKHGKDWVFADLPYHLMYFDREIADGLDGGGVPREGAVQLTTMRELDAWNAAEFANRPAGQPVEAARQELKAIRDRLRGAMSSMADGDLENPAWSRLPGVGTTAKESLLRGCLAHNYSEYVQIAVRVKGAPLPSPKVAREAMAFYMSFMPAFMNKEKSAGKSLVAAMVFKGLDDGAWTLRVADGRCTVSPGVAPDAQLVMTQAPETMIKTMNHMQNPMIATLTGKIRVKGLRQLPTFGALFPEPSLDTVIEPGAFTG